jgi:hypothetical protein
MRPVGGDATPGTKESAGALAPASMVQVVDMLLLLSNS